MEPLVGGLVSGKLKPHRVREGQEALPQEFRSDIFFHILNLTWRAETPDASTGDIPWPPSSTQEQAVLLFLALNPNTSNISGRGRAVSLSGHGTVCIRNHLVPGSVTSGKSQALLGPPFPKPPGLPSESGGEQMETLGWRKKLTCIRERYTGRAEEISAPLDRSPCLFLCHAPHPCASLCLRVHKKDIESKGE